MLLTFDNTPLPLFFFFYLLTPLIFPELRFLFTAVRPWESPEDPRGEQIRRGGQEAGGHGAGSQGEVVVKCLSWAVFTLKEVVVQREKKKREIKTKWCRTTSLAKPSQACPVKTFIARQCFPMFGLIMQPHTHQWKMFLTFGEEWMKRSSPCGVSDYFLAASGW